MKVSAYQISESALHAALDAALDSGIQSPIRHIAMQCTKLNYTLLHCTALHWSLLDSTNIFEREKIKDNMFAKYIFQISHNLEYSKVYVVSGKCSPMNKKTKLYVLP